MFKHEKYMSKYEGKIIDRIYSNLPKKEKERFL